MARQKHRLSLHQATELFGLLGDPSRLRIALLLARAGEMHGRELVAQLGLSQPVVSNHLKWLRMGGLVEFRRDGKRHYYRLATRVVTDLLRLVCDPALPEGPK
jgi:DNA-binding transcriptional ArsR family regulator